jgi:hypothetical protein
MMDTPAFAATRFVRPALRVALLYISIIMISMAMVKPAQASGNLSTPPSLQYSVSEWVTAVNTNPGTLSPVFVYTSTPISCSNSSLDVLATCVAAAAGGAVWYYSYDGNFTGGNPDGFTDAIASHLGCPEHAQPTSTTTCTCNNPTALDSINYVPDSTGTSCMPAAVCPVGKLKPMDPAMQPYEDGIIDMTSETQATRDGATCIVREARTRHLSPRIASGYRPPAYQTHIREVYDKWQLLENNNDSVCADTKRQVEIEYKRHSKFSHQPGNTSRHSSGRAVDIHLSAYTDADIIAAGCNSMSRPVANDRSHFESSR